MKLLLSSRIGETTRSAPGRFKCREGIGVKGFVVGGGGGGAGSDEPSIALCGVKGRDWLLKTKLRGEPALLDPRDELRKLCRCAGCEGRV